MKTALLVLAVAACNGPTITHEPLELAEAEAAPLDASATYVATVALALPPDGQPYLASALCDAGDTALAGGCEWGTWGLTGGSPDDRLEPVRTQPAVDETGALVGWTCGGANLGGALPAGVLVAHAVCAVAP